MWWMTSKNNKTPLLFYIETLCIISNPLVNLNWSYSPEMLNSGQNWWFFCDLENNRAPLQYYIKLCASFQSRGWIQTEVTIRKRTIWVEIGNFFYLVDLQIWWMTLENNRAPLLYYIKLCASFQSHGWIKTWVTVRKRSILVKIGNFLSCVILKFDGWPWKTIGHLFYVASSFVHHFIAIGEFKLELQSEDAQFGSKSTTFEPCDLEIWRMTLNNKRAPLLCYFKILCIIS